MNWHNDPKQAAGAPGEAVVPVELAPARKHPTPRARATWIPNQHGAWAMLAGPLIVGIVAAGAAWVHLPLTLLWFTGYFAFFAAGLWLKSRRKPRYRPPVLVFSAACLPLAAIVLALRPDLIRWAPVFAPLLAVGLWLAAQRRDRSLSSGLATTLAASLMTAVAYDAGDGTDWARAWTLTAVVAAYYVGTLLYVKSVIRERNDPRYAALSVGFHAAATVAMAWVSWPLVAVFAVLTARAAWVPRRRFTPKQVGIGEIVLNLLVVVVALATV